MRLRTFFFTIGLLAIASLAQAQTPAPPAVTVGQVYQVQASHDGINAAGYRLYVDTVQVADVPAAQLVAGKITLTAPPITTRGSHTVTVSAYNLDKETQSDPLVFSGFLPAPGKPGGVTIIINISIP